MIMQRMIRRMVCMVLPSMAITSHCAVEDIRYEVYTGSAIGQFSSTLNYFRSYMFAEYPYLFRPANPAMYSVEQNDENVMYEASERTVIVCAFVGTKLIGCAVGMPLDEFNATDPDTNAGCYISDPNYASFRARNPQAFYFNELLIEPMYRALVDLNQLYTRMVDALHSVFPECATICMLKIDTSYDDPLRPDNYEESSLSLERLEHRLLVQQGFVQTDDMLRITWNTIQVDGTVCMQEHPLRLWKKSLY